MNAVSRQANNPLYYVQSRLGRRQEHHDIAKAYVAVGKERANPGTLWRELHAVYKHVVANQPRVFHRTRRNLKRLYDERDDEQPGYQYGSQRREKLDRSFLRFLFCRSRFFDVFFLRHSSVSVP